MTIPLFIYGQSNSSQSTICEELLRYNFISANHLVLFKKDTILKQAYKNLTTLLYNRGTQPKKDTLILIDSNFPSRNREIEVINKIIKAYYYLLYDRRSPITINALNEARLYAKEYSSPCFFKLSLLSQMELYARENVLNEKNFLVLIEEFDKYSDEEKDRSWSIFYKNLYESRTSRKENNYKKYSIQSIEYYHHHKNSMSIGVKSHFLENIATYYRSNNKKDSAKKYLKKLISLPDKPYLKINKFNAFLDLGALALIEKDTLMSKLYFDQAKSSITMRDSLFALQEFYRFKTYYYNIPLKKHKEASNSFKKYDSVRRKLETQQNNLKISESEVEFRTNEIEARRKKNSNIVIILSIILFLGSIIALLIYRSTKRKQRIAEQERELEIQKTTQILKEKEVETINAMVEGQEKERLRLAGELHDNLGSTLATVKMQVENLERNLEKVDDPKVLLSKTNTLINEAYQKVRRISHERHSGVMAKEGLLPAVQKLAKQISSNGKLQIDVQDFGLENRLSNHLEITIFRIVQELITNIVKHAKATEASISLTQHDSELNIIVEDNGKGFKVGKLETKNGMGLGSIERRVEHLEGSMEVDSTIGKGTNIIIDLPIQSISNEIKD